MKSNSGRYSSVLQDHFLHPRNRLAEDEQFDYTHTIEAENDFCGDRAGFLIRCDKNLIVDVRWWSEGCAVSVANLSLLSTMIKDKTIKEALAIKPKDLQKALGGVPFRKKHCSTLGCKILKEIFKNEDKEEKDNGRHS